MNLKIGIILIGLLFISCDNNESSSQIDEEATNCAIGTSTANILVNIDEEIYNDDESVLALSKYSWSSDGTSRILNGNGIPNHEVGTFPNSNNPNSISVQNVSKSFTLCPSIIYESGLEVVGPAMAIAYALNSVKFDPATAGRCNDAGECSLARGEGNWNIEALGHDTFDFGDDINHAHVQPNGAYHYHGMPELLIDFLGGNDDGMTLIGWASDGFPVYARYGYADPKDSQSQLKALTTSYRLKSQADENRPNTLTAILGGPNATNNINKLIPMGAFTQDYEYVEGLGDLDECNGRFGTTPEFPNGIYYYVVSDDFPFFTRCLKGGV